MNLLAHIYLSGDNDLLKIGNFMADGIHGQPSEELPAEVQKGILLHRHIDTFTDAHPVFRQTTKRLHPGYHHYAGVIADIFYDHFLARNWANYNTIPLKEYTRRFYMLLQDNYALLTEKTKAMLPYMLKEDWLARYAEIDGIAITLRNMDRRTRNNSRMAHAVTELVEYYADFELEFTTFFEEVQAFVKLKISEL